MSHRIVNHEGTLFLHVVIPVTEDTYDRDRHETYIPIKDVFGTGFITASQSEKIADLAELTAHGLQGLSFEEMKATLIGLIAGVRLSTTQEIEKSFTQHWVYDPTLLPGMQECVSRGEYRYGRPLGMVMPVERMEKLAEISAISQEAGNYD